MGRGQRPRRRPSGAPPAHASGSLRRSRRLLDPQGCNVYPRREDESRRGSPPQRANDAPSSGLGIELGDHRHAGPIPVTPRASSSCLAGTLRPAPPSQPGRHAACQGPAPRAAARPKPPPPRRAPCLLAKNFRRPPPSSLTGPRHRPPPRSRRRRRPAKILGASTAPAAAVGGGRAGGAPDGRLPATMAMMIRPDVSRRSIQSGS